MGGRAGFRGGSSSHVNFLFIIIFNTKDFAEHVWFNPGLPTIL